ncbi:MAG: molybdate ABC transporter substrate-binding protein [Gammaproteobacteria bacterium]|nr:MAG: molybdate ABC transporter substrate-binding protein [Gammaproteobacteria bacterium]
MLHLAALLCLMIGLAPAWAGEARIAVASNFATAMPYLAERFRQQTGHELIVSTASTGKLYAQIIHGAPFDVYLAADDKYPRRLEREGRAVPGSGFTYAIGRLALWSPRTGYVDAQGEVLKQGGFRRLAVANPRLAPYGEAAREALVKLGLWTGLQPKMVFGENIAQTYQFVASGNAELGFVAYSQIKWGTGSHWLVPASLHSPLRQDAVLLRRGQDNPAARAFLAFLRSPAATAIIESQGYGRGD